MLAQVEHHEEDKRHKAAMTRAETVSAATGSGAVEVCRLWCNITNPY